MRCEEGTASERTRGEVFKKEMWFMLGLGSCVTNCLLDVGTW